MDVAQLFSDFLLGLSRMADFFGGVEKFFSGVRWFLGGTHLDIGTKDNPELVNVFGSSDASTDPTPATDGAGSSDKPKA
ncbi:hypothetical protein L1O03_08580 [Corynebacterium uropygiale]|uniref:Cell wall channel n=1 Tax=Corynebacterium uropygiale TaxID=1775911 RepID=A0A9X1QT10_9CORY|nr:hypothetical protein [Corynebacterium uropygiale]MCF4007228.1 hypothetical protein [Corynebacterium uropygiale]